MHCCHGDLSACHSVYICEGKSSDHGNHGGLMAHPRCHSSQAAGHRVMVHTCYYRKERRTATPPVVRNTDLRAATMPAYSCLCCSLPTLLMLSTSKCIIQFNEPQNTHLPCQNRLYLCTSALLLSAAAFILATIKKKGAHHPHLSCQHRLACCHHACVSLPLLFTVNIVHACYPPSVSNSSGEPQNTHLPCQHILYLCTSALLLSAASFILATVE
jgi:hypothetical protein